MEAGTLLAFHFVVMDERGRVMTWQAEAATADEARRLASVRGYSVMECRPARAATDTPMTNGRRTWSRPAHLDAIGFALDLATLLEAGVSIKEGIATLARRENFAARRRILNDVNLLLSQGLRLSVALERVGAFAPLLIATVAASEQTGDVAVGLSRFAKHQQGLRALGDRMVGACAYPLLLLIVGFLVVLVLLGVVVPRFAQVIDVQARQLPLLSKLLMSWGGFVGSHPIVPVAMLAGFVALLCYAVAQWKDPRRRRTWLERIPGAHKLAREFQHLQMYRTTAILTSRGIPVQKALEYSLDYLSSRGQQQLRESLVHIRAGASITAALVQSGLADEVASSMLSVADRGGALPEMLDRIADFYDRSLQRKVDIASRLIEPVLMIVFGVLIGGIVLLMYLPIFDLASSVS
jgi:general secretion pathway protein F